MKKQKLLRLLWENNRKGLDEGMIKKNIFDLQGDEVLGKTLMTSDFQIILPEGTTIKKEYISKIMELGIFEVYIKEKQDITEIEILKAEVKCSITEKVKSILERHTYHQNSDLIDLVEAADRIITTIIEEEQVVEKVYDIKERSTDIYEHSINVCSLAILTALKLKISEKIVHDIGVGCLLHEIGLRYITIDYINRNLTDLHVNELTEYKKHPVYGYSSIKEEEWISQLTKNIILHHHERMDGSGFPLRITAIPIECMIVNVCDTFDEMICGIGNQKMKVYEAIEYLKTFQNVLFDAKIINTFLSFTAMYPAGTRVLTNQGEVAVVVSQNKEFIDRPIIKILKDANGVDIKQDVQIDLLKVHNVFIEGVVD